MNEIRNGDHGGLAHRLARRHNLRMDNTEFLARLGPAALVTGASSGIGQSYAKLLAAMGFNLVLVARRVERLEALSAELAESFGTQTTVLPVDLAAPDAAQQILAGTEAQDIGLVVSNAGFGIKGELAAGDPVAMAEMISVNCTVPMLLAHGFIPRLRARRAAHKGGGIIFTGSVEGLIACPYSTAYSASKAMVKALGEGLWAELEPEGIDILALLPGATATEAAAKAGVDPATLSNVQSPDEVARLALENLGKGPTYIPSDHYRAMFGQLLQQPREQTLRMLAQGMKPKN
jgi:short-subunit dehydrogenase